jgi:flavin-dependent dehydrogenase
MREVVVIGAGLAGMVSSILLARKSNFKVTLLEKKTFPFHRVCGEYLSNETLPFLKRESLLPEGVDFPQIKKFRFTNVNGKGFQIPLDLGGFGISRHLFDAHLWKIAQKEVVETIEGVEVTDLKFKDERFTLSLSKGGPIEADFVIGAFGKKSRMDVSMNRDHLQQPSNYIGVKYHVRSDITPDVVELHNFPGGYCGASQVENGITNLCYLAKREDLRKYGDIESLEQNLLAQNPELNHYLNHSERLFEKPVVINDFGFQKKRAVENHVLMAGDAAGLITPLCGNGMAIAIHSAKLAAEALEKPTRAGVEQHYRNAWKINFGRRLSAGRKIQSLFGGPLITKAAANMPGLAKILMPYTHGQPF